MLAVAGIANPSRFVDSLRESGWNVVDSIAFADHHRYTAKDIAAIDAKLKASGADVVFTTEKDAVRLEGLSLPFAAYRVPLVVQFDPPDALFQSVMAVLAVRDTIEYWAVVAVQAVARRLPESVVNALGAAIGLTFYIVDWQHRRVALGNLEQCFPNKTVQRAPRDCPRHVQTFRPGAAQAADVQRA